MNARAQLLPGSHVEITCGTVQAATITDENGTRDVLTDLGSRLFFVDIVEADGARVTMWDGDNHADAQKQARTLCLDFGPVHDLTGGTA